jgi:PASTA domain
LVVAGVATALTGSCTIAASAGTQADAADAGRPLATQVDPVVSASATRPILAPPDAVVVDASVDFVVRPAGEGPPGHAGYSPTPSVVRTFAIAKASQAITFAALPSKRLGDLDFTIRASASSGLAVSFSARGPCTIGGARVHLTGVGTCTITAFQSGNANYNAARAVARSFWIGPRPMWCAVPSVVGLRLATARSRIAKGHCRTGTVAHAYSARRRKGVVIAQSRLPRVVLPANSKINLVVSRGRRR